MLEIAGILHTYTKLTPTGVVFDDPAVSDRVEKILHPERFEGQGITEIKPFSVLKELAEKKKEAMQARPPERQRSLTTELAISRGLGSSPTSNFLEPGAEGNWHEKDVCPTNALLRRFVRKTEAG